MRCLLRPILLLSLWASNQVLAFAPVRRHTAQNHVVPSILSGGNKGSSMAEFPTPFLHRDKTQLCMTQGDSETEGRKPFSQGIGRGKYLLGIVLFLCVWIFSIPPEFRRAYICSDRCAEGENRKLEVCHNCVTAEEWRSGIAEYYKNGGGIQFDFSIDPNSPFLL